MPTNPQELTGPQLRQAFRLAFERLEESRDTVNALNVFPVPDGDTGTNMSLTLRSGIERCPDIDGQSAGEVAHELAQGTFFGARGNSGVILSQFFKGFSDALQDRDICTADDLAQALDKARVAAYGAVGNPREGTMLTVIRSAAEAALGTGAGVDITGVLETAFGASCVALRNTPEQLPVLKEAGVVDSGGLGVVVILGGALESLAAERYENARVAAGLRSIIDSSMASLGGSGQLQEQSFVDASLEEAWGYCTELIISGSGLSLESVRQHCEEMGRSTVVVGDSSNVRIHVHMEDPGVAISYGVALGTVSKVKIENMDEQNVEWAAGHGDAPAPSAGAPLTVVAVAAGQGLAGLFSESGCGHVIEGGQTMNPSVQQIMQGVARAGAEHTIFLPNNKNIVLTAQQVAANDPTVYVVPTSSIPQGVAAMLAYNPTSTLEENLSAMAEVLPTVTTIEITQAVRDTSVEGVPVSLGDYIALLNDKLVLTAQSPEVALEQTVEMAGVDAGSILTIYRGSDADSDAAEACADTLEERTPGLQVDHLYGGQPHYHYLASIE
jgi:DAK2 domain fusion protein YloV